jgi:hypothetical protein
MKFIMLGTATINLDHLYGILVEDATHSRLLLPHGHSVVVSIPCDHLTDWLNTSNSQAYIDAYLKNAAGTRLY